MNDIVYAGKHASKSIVTRHQHKDTELIYCTSGGGSMLFDGLTLPYGEGDIVVIPPYLPHANSSGEGFSNIHINLADPTLVTKRPFVIHDDSNHFLLNAFSAVFFHYSELDRRNAALLSAYGDLIASYIQYYEQTTPRSTPVEDIERAIIHNYPDCDFELDSYLQGFPFNYDYLRKLFKKELGITPHQYLIDKRLQAAADYLCVLEGADGSVTEISRQCGFREPLYFSRMFKKKYGVAPSYYAAFKRQEKAAYKRDPESVKIYAAQRSEKDRSNKQEEHFQ